MRARRSLPLILVAVALTVVVTSIVGAHAPGDCEAPEYEFARVSYWLEDPQVITDYLNEKAQQGWVLDQMTVDQVDSDSAAVCYCVFRR